MSIASVMASSHPILWCPPLRLPPILPSIRDFSSELTVCIWLPKYWSFSFSISPSNEYSGLISLQSDWFDLPDVQGTLRIFSSTTVQRHQFFGVLTSLWSSSHSHSWPLGRPYPWLYKLCWQNNILITAWNSSSLAFLMMCSIYRLNKQGDSRRRCCTPFSILIQSVAPYRVLTVASWPTYTFFRRQIRWSGISISLRAFHSLLWSTQSKDLA